MRAPHCDRTVRCVCYILRKGTTRLRKKRAAFAVVFRCVLLLRQAADRVPDTSVLLGGNTMMPKTDAQINQDVFDELTWDPAVPIADLNIDTMNARVLLTGTVETLWEKQESSRA